MTVAAKKRKNMKHLSEMNDYDFCNWILLRRTGPIELSWKLDGFFLRFGKDEQGRPWFQTARSPVLYDPMELIWYAVGKSNEAMARAEVYFHLITAIWNSEAMSYLDEDCGYECEVFDKAASTLDHATGLRTFVNVPYLDSFFEKNITLAVYRKIKSSTGEIIEHGYECGTPRACSQSIATFGTRFFIRDDFHYFETCVLDLLGKPIDSLKSLRHADRPLKLATKTIVQKLKSQLGAYILNEAAKQNDMGPNFEGVVLSVNNIEFKVTTEYFRTLIAFKDVLSG